MSKSTTIICDRIEYIAATLSGEVIIECRDLDLRFLLDINPRELLTNMDVYAVMNELCIDELQEYIRDRLNE